MLDLVAQPNTQKDRTMTNPLNLNYQFYTDGVSHRTSADPVIQYFNGKYYLFGSHNEGYYSSPDLKTWTYIHSTNLPLVKEWAPAVLIYEGAIYYMAFNNATIYKSTNPDADQWEKINAKYNLPIGDPAFFKDDDGRVYLVAGCSSGGSIQGVELDPNDGFKMIGKLVDLLPHNVKKYGWEVPGDNNERTDKDTWNEGPCLIKSDGLYYLQYATPGTEFASYSTGVYVSKNPLGPYTCSVSNPFATKLTGFVAGAGHGYTFQDKYANYWYVTSMLIGVREHYERRLGIFPVYFDSSDGYMRAHTAFSDFPFVLPDKKVDFKSENISAGMNLLSYNKTVTASSSKVGFEPKKATDESIKTWWSAVTDNAGEWFQMDLGRSMTISAIQMNFADEAFTIHRGNVVPIYQYIVETSTNGNDWVTTIDRSQNTNDFVHELIVLDESVNARFVRVTNKRKLGNGCFSIYDLRIFGKDSGNTPAKVTGFTCKRQGDSRRVRFTWDQQEANTRYVIYWGTDTNRIDNAVMLTGESADIGLFNVDLGYYFTIEAFTESGIGSKSEPVYVKVSDAIPDILHFDQTDKSIKLSSSVAELDITPLFDNAASTILSTVFQKDMYVDVKLSEAVKITSYSITAGTNPNENIKSWELWVLSANNWIKVDEQINKTFRPSETLFFNITYASYSAIKSSNNYRLIVKENNGGENSSMAEWQMFGSSSVFKSSITSTGGKMTDKYNLNANEGVQYLIDKNADTKYCAVDKGETFWVQYSSPTPAKITKYSLTSANDAPGRDPVKWVLQASNDGVKWETLDSQINQEFPSRFVTMEFDVTNDNKNNYYTQFRLNINAIKSGRTFQLGEWHLFGDLMDTSVKELENAEINVWSDCSRIVISSHANTPGNYKIYNTTGQLICYGKIDIGSKKTTKLNSGIYVVVLLLPNGRFSKKIQVM